jgi:RNA polymerase sigma-B factor
VTIAELNRAVIAYRRDNDLRARATVIESYLPLVRGIARRFAGRGERLEDLVQVGVLGLIAAIDRCDPERADQLTAYSTRCVEGEIRRHLRDRCAPLRVPRRLQSDAALMAAVRMPLSLEDEPEEGGATHPPDDVGVARALVASAARSLDRRERRVVALRYFLDLSQAEIGDVVGLSQVHVGRVLRDAIAKMRTRVVFGEEAAAAYRNGENGVTL